MSPEVFAAPTIDATQRAFVRRFETLGPEPMARYAFLVSLARSLPAYPAAMRTRAFEHIGCESKTWWADRSDKQRLRFIADSEAVLVRGFIAVLHHTYNGRLFSDVRQYPVEPFFALLDEQWQLSPGRQSGLRALAERIERRTD
ncbi:MAG: SufE family protein [Pseudomonadota bacterium]